MAGVLTLNLVLQKSKIDDIRRIQKLNICAAQLQDIGVLRQATNLEILSLSLNEIAELGVISNCRRLTELYLRKNYIRDINQILHLSRLPCLEVLNLSDNPVSRDPNYRRFVIAAIPPLERLDDRDVTDEERHDALSVFPQLLNFAPPPSRYADPTGGYTPPSLHEREAQAKAQRNSGSASPAGSPSQRQQSAKVAHPGLGNSSSGHQQQARRAAAPVPPEARVAVNRGEAPAAPPPRRPAYAKSLSSTSVAVGPSEEGVVQAVKVLCSELSLEALEEIRRFIDAMAGY